MTQWHPLLSAQFSVDPPCQIIPSPTFTYPHQALRPPCSYLSLSTARERNDFKGKVRKAAGLDGINSRLLTSCSDQLCGTVEYLLKKNLMLGATAVENLQCGKGTNNQTLADTDQSLLCHIWWRAWTGPSPPSNGPFYGPTKVDLPSHRRTWWHHYRPPQFLQCFQQHIADTSGALGLTTSSHPGCWTTSPTEHRVGKLACASNSCGPFPLHSLHCRHLLSLTVVLKICHLMTLHPHQGWGQQRLSENLCRTLWSSVSRTVMFPKGRPKSWWISRDNWTGLEWQHCCTW